MGTRADTYAGAVQAAATKRHAVVPTLLGNFLRGD